MSKVLKLYNTFTRSLNEVHLNGKPVTTIIDTQKPIYGSFYICGPTVYSDSHVGHALTYIRSDLFRRFLKSLFNVRLHTVMNITDVDDKILDKTREVFTSELPEDPSKHPFRTISEKYYSSFTKDLNSIRVIPADLYVKVSDNIDLITNFIRKLEKNDHAYIASDGDVRFKVQSVDNYIGRLDTRKTIANEVQKIDLRDFVLWKAKKPNEPAWLYKSVDGRCIPGRPGWHVQCSAISSAIFGDKLNFHFGGKDLIFPHHYNEEACCCAYHSLDTSKTLHVWADNWLHSGHLIMRDEKMSKSLGNVIAINNFIDRSSKNALRLLCIYTHYRSDIEFNENLMDNLKALDHKISAFISYLNELMKDLRVGLCADDSELEEAYDGELKESIAKVQQIILNGVCDDFHLDTGLQSIIELSKILYSKSVSKLRPTDLMSCWSLVNDWCEICGLEYVGSTDNSLNNAGMLEVLVNFRQRTRSLAINGVKALDGNTASNSNLLDILKECDKVRESVGDLGYVIRDPKTGAQ